MPHTAAVHESELYSVSMLTVFTASSAKFHFYNCKITTASICTNGKEKELRQLNWYETNTMNVGRNEIQPVYKRI